MSSLSAKIHLVVSLILFLGVPLKDLLHFLFSSSIHKVRALSGQFIAFHPDYAIPFGPSDVYNLWHEKFARCRERLHTEIVEPCAHKIVLAESTKCLKDKSLKIRIKDLTMDTIRRLLNPMELTAKYRSLAPFTFKLLEIFTTSPNDYRRKKNKKNQRMDIDAEEDSESDASGDEAVWMGEPPEGAGMHEKPTRGLVVSVHMQICQRQN